MVEITKDTAAFVKERLPDACIYKTMKSCGNKRGVYYAEESNAVLKLISQYRKELNVVEEYPACK